MANTKLDIRMGLIQSIVNAALPYPAQWPNQVPQLNGQDYKPNNEPWIRVTILNMDDGIPTLGAGGRDQVIGAMQVDVFLPKGSGDIKAYQITDELRAILNRGKTLLHNGQCVRITSSSSRSGTDEPDWYSKIINVEFTSYLTRS